jgi:hypothetical protein
MSVGITVSRPPRPQLQFIVFAGPMAVEFISGDLHLDYRLCRNKEATLFDSEREAFAASQPLRDRGLTVSIGDENADGPRLYAEARARLAKSNKPDPAMPVGYLVYAGHHPVEFLDGNGQAPGFRVGDVALATLFTDEATAFGRTSLLRTLGCPVRVIPVDPERKPLYEKKYVICFIGGLPARLKADKYGFYIDFEIVESQADATEFENSADCFKSTYLLRNRGHVVTAGPPGCNGEETYQRALARDRESRRPKSYDGQLKQIVDAGPRRTQRHAGAAPAAAVARSV